MRAATAVAHAEKQEPARRRHASPMPHPALDAAGKSRIFPPMRVLLFSLVSLLLAASAALAKDYDADVAAYDALLAAVPPGETTIALGDMLVPVATVQLWRDQLAGTAPADNASQTGINKWTGGIVYYAFNANVSAVHQTATVDAMGEWATFANLTFTPHGAQANYIMINEVAGLGGGNSSVGMIGGVQQLNIGPTSWNRGTLVHELGHALGLIHEHQRGDGANSRNNFVTINFSNAPGGASDGNFILIPNSTSNGAYDFLSVMHYARKAFAVNPALDTITPLAAYAQFADVMGNNPDRVLSLGDRTGIVAMYGGNATPATVVTNTKDSGPGSLRAAIYSAVNATVTFSIPVADPNFSGGVFTIRPTDRLPAPGTGATIDATTQTTFTGDTNASGPEVVLSGALQTDASTFGLGLRLSQSGVTVKGLVINGFNTRGVLITGAGATGNTVTGCYIGTNAAGTAAVANTFEGIRIESGATGNRVGGSTAAARNVISGNAAQGISIRDAGTNGNFIEGNWIGLNAAGTGALPNAFAGVEISSGPQSNRVGGTVAGTGNVLSGNTSQGLAINGANSNLVLGNFVGTNAAGTGAVANGFSGIQLFGGAQSNTIGGTTAAARNILSGNTNQGVTISGAGTSGNVVLGNYVGLNAAGTAAVPNVFAGVEIFGAAANNTIGGTAAGAANVLSGNSAQGAAISGAGSTGNVVAGNFIGTNPAGTASIPNAYSGVGIFSGATANTIGGTATGAGNLISGNTDQGIFIGDAGTNGNTVAGNVIGLNAAGTAAVKNGFAGVEIGNGAQNNVIGGTTAAARNIISGNQNQGVALDTAGTTGNRVSGNYIGTNPAGTAAIGNGFPGVEIFSSASGNIIGGTAPGAGNVISGNSFRGVTLTDAGTTGNVLAGNLIGLNAAATAALPNAGPGIQIFGGAHDNTIGSTSGGRNFIAGNNGAGLTLSGAGTSGNVVVGNSIGVTPTGTTIANTSEGVALFADGSGGATGNTIGGSTLGAANLISGNGLAGVGLYNTGTINNRVSGNSIFANTGIGIDIFGNGVTANDLNDPDAGPNNVQNFPVLSSAVLGTATTFNGSLNSTNATFRLEFFEGATAATAGQNFIGTINVTTAANNITFNGTALPAIVPAGHFITATATDPNGNTSEFAAAIAVTTTDADADGLPDAYELAHWPLISTTTGSADSDGDGMTNAQEFRAGTDPRNAASILRLGPPVTSGSDKIISLPSLAGHTYRIDFADDLLSANHWRTLADQIPGTGATLTITDPGAAALTQRYYRAVVLP